MYLLKKIIIIGSLLFWLVNNLFSQVDDYRYEYTPLMSGEQLPITVTTPSSKKYKKQLSRIRKGD